MTEYFSQVQDMTDALPCHIYLPVCLWIMDPHSRAAKENTSHGNEVLPQDTTHLKQRPYYQREVCAEIQLVIGPHEYLLTTVKRRKLKWYGHVSRSLGPDKTILRGTVKGGRRQGRQRKRWEDKIRPGVRQVPEGSVEQMEDTGCEVICGAPTALAVKGQVIEKL